MNRTEQYSSDANNIILRLRVWITLPKHRSVSLKTEMEVRDGDAEILVFSISGFADKLDWVIQCS